MNSAAVPTAAAARPDAEPEEPQSGDSSVAVRMRASGRGVALAILASLAVVVALEWAQKFVISLLLGILIAYALNPLVAWLERIRVPRLAGTMVVMACVVGALALGAYSLRGQVQAVIEELPEAAGKVSARLARMRDGELTAVQKVQNAASTIEKATAQAAAGGAPPPKQSATHVVIEQPSFKLGSLVWEGSRGAVAFVVQAAMVLFLVFFLLLAGDTFKRKLVRLTGPSLSRRKITVHILDDINASIQKYMFMLLITNTLVGVLCWIAFYWIGLENAGAWAVAAGLLHVIPYLGPSITAVITGIAAFLQFDAVPTALLVSGASIAIATFVGTFVTTWMTGRIASMNTAAVFISLLFFGWLWGVWGLLLSIPIIVIVKVVSQHVDQLQPVAELLGD